MSAARATAAGHGNAFSAVARLHFKLLSLHLIPHRNDIQHIHRAIIIQVAAAGGGVGCGILAEAVAHRNQVEDVHLAVVTDVARQVFIRADVDRRRAVEVAVDDPRSDRPAFPGRTRYNRSVSVFLAPVSTSWRAVEQVELVSLFPQILRPAVKYAATPLPGIRHECRAPSSGQSQDEAELRVGTVETQA